MTDAKRVTAAELDAWERRYSGACREEYMRQALHACIAEVRRAWADTDEAARRAVDDKYRADLAEAKLKEAVEALRAHARIEWGQDAGRNRVWIDKVLVRIDPTWKPSV